MRTGGYGVDRRRANLLKTHKTTAHQTNPTRAAHKDASRVGWGVPAQPGGRAKPFPRPQKALVQPGALPPSTTFVAFGWGVPAQPGGRAKPFPRGQNASRRQPRGADSVGTPLRAVDRSRAVRYLRLPV